MFDFHIHSHISFDSEEEPQRIIDMAEKNGIKEICFTDHIDHHYYPEKHHRIFSIEDYKLAYDNLTSSSIKIRRGVETGLTQWNQKELDKILGQRNFDFVLGSVHYSDGYDPYFEEYWQKNDYKKGVELYFREILACVKQHGNFDVLGHLTYICKSASNPERVPVPYREVADIVDEIFKLLVAKGKGLEVNTSGVDKIGDFLPSADYLKRFRELGGEMITIGSDSHDASRVGQYTFEALEMVSTIFPYVCTFQNRLPIFHKI